MMICQEQDARLSVRKKMAEGLSGTGCLAVFQEQELSLKETKILWSVRKKMEEQDGWWSIMDKIVRGLSVCQENVCGCLVVYHGQEDNEICQCLIASDNILTLHAMIPTEEFRSYHTLKNVTFVPRRYKLFLQ
jgi:hypothetical protein